MAQHSERLRPSIDDTTGQEKPAPDDDNDDKWELPKVVDRVMQVGCRLVEQVDEANVPVGVD